MFSCCELIARGRAWPFDETVTSPVSSGELLELQTHDSKFIKLQGSLLHVMVYIDTRTKSKDQERSMQKLYTTTLSCMNFKSGYTVKAVGYCHGFCVTLLDANSPVCLGGSIMVVVYLITLAGNCWMTVKLVC